MTPPSFTHDHKYTKIEVTRADGTVMVFDLTDESSEPCFFFRGQDKFASKVVGFYSDLLEAAEVDTDQVEHAREHAAALHHWPHQKVPD